MDDLPGRKLREVSAPLPLHDLMVRLGRGKEVVPAVSSGRSSRYPADQVGELVQLYRSFTGAPGSAYLRRSRFSEESSPTRRPSKRGRRAIQAVQ